MKRHNDAQELPAASCDLRVGGMDCPSCADGIKRSLQALEGIQDVQVDVLGGRVRVHYAEGKVARGDIAGAITRIGYPVLDGEARRASFTVDGMDCAEEVRQIEDKLGKLPGVTDLRFDLMSRRLVVEGAISFPEIERALKDIGLTARPEGEAAKPAGFWQRRGRLVLMGVSGLFLAAGLALEWAGAAGGLAIPLFALSTVAGAWYIAPRAFRAARNIALDMNFLMLISAVGASLIGEWAEGASVVFLFSVAELLKTYSMDRARNAIKALMDLSPTEATVRREGQEVTIPAADVSIGEVMVIRPGQKIPLDGEVTAGRSAVNQAPITGESLPVGKEPGAEVFAGSINEQGMLEVRVTKLVADTTLARIIHAVEEAQASRAPSQSFVDRFSRIYTPAVVALALLVLLVPPLLSLGDWSVWFYRALAMLVIACPCALVISTPACGPGGQATGAVPPGGRLGGAAAAVAVDPADGPCRRTGSAPGRRDDSAGADEDRPQERPGGAAGGDAHRRGEARDPLRAEQRQAGGHAGGVGPGAVHAAPDRGGVRGGQAGDRPGALRGPQLGGVAPPRDAVAAGAVVPVLRAAAARGGKPRR